MSPGLWVMRSEGQHKYYSQEMFKVKVKRQFHQLDPDIQDRIRVWNINALKNVNLLYTILHHQKHVSFHGSPRTVPDNPSRSQVRIFMLCIIVNFTWTAGACQSFPRIIIAIMHFVWHQTAFVLCLLQLALRLLLQDIAIYILTTLWCDLQQM